MTRIRRVALWLTFSAMVLLSLLCVVGAFLGAERARALFNSPPLVLFWVVVASLLVVSLVMLARPGGRAQRTVTPGARVSLASPALHLGSLLILVGAFAQSDTARGLAARFTSARQFARGYVAITEGQDQDAVFDATMKRQVGQLPFKVHLSDFVVERYPAGDAPWALVAHAGGQGVLGRWQPSTGTALPWRVGESITLPHWPLQLQVLRYLPKARPVYPVDVPSRIQVSGNEALYVSLPAVAGAAVSARELRATIRVVRILPDSAIVEITAPSGFTSSASVPLRRGGFAQLSGLTLRCAMPEPVGAAPDPQSDLPAMELLAGVSGRRTRHWLVPDAHTRSAGLLPQMRDERAQGPRYQTDEQYRGQGLPDVFLVEPEGPVRSFKSHVDIVKDGQSVARAVIEVNRPLHYGGYYFHQLPYGEGEQPYTVLQVTRDSGMFFVYAGFVLLCFGTVWWSWVQPALVPRPASRDGPLKNHDS